MTPPPLVTSNAFCVRSWEKGEQQRQHKNVIHFLGAAAAAAAQIREK